MEIYTIFCKSIIYVNIKIQLKKVENNPIGFASKRICFCCKNISFLSKKSLFLKVFFLHFFLIGFPWHISV